MVKTNPNLTELDRALQRIGKLEDVVALLVQLLTLNRPPLYKTEQYNIVLNSVKELVK